MRTALRVLLASSLLFALQASAGALAGNFIGEDDPAASLTLSESADGRVTGSLSDGQTSMPISGQRREAGLSGTVGVGGEALPFTATVNVDRIVLTVGPPDEGESIAFRRSGASQASGQVASPKPQAGAAGSGSQEPPAAKQGRNVVINTRRLGDQELTQVEQAYRIRIPDADYWYDPVSGAWGPQGGPTLGFILPGLPLGGPLRPDASGGSTKVFVNGRELPVYDVIALSQLTGPIQPGRYFITSQGLAGFEGGPPLWNLLAMAAPGSSGSNSWQSRLSSGFSDGTTGAVFLPNGGIVSTGN